MRGFLVYILIVRLINENQVYSVLHLSQEYDFAPGISLTNAFLFILCLDTDLHRGHAFIIKYICLDSRKLVIIKQIKPRNNTYYSFNLQLVFVMACSFFQSIHF